MLTREPHDGEIRSRGHRGRHPLGTLVMGPPRPADNVVTVGEEGRKSRFAVAVPEGGPGQPAPGSAANHAFHHNRTRQVEPDKQVCTLQEQGPGIAVLPLGHPRWLGSERSDVAHEVLARSPVRPVVERVYLCARYAHHDGDSPGQCRLARAGRASDEDSPGGRAQRLSGVRLPYWNRDGSPIPTRTTTGYPSDQSTTVVRSWPHSPAYTTASITSPSSSWICHPSFIGSSASGSRRVLERSGSPSSRSRARTRGWLGMRTPTVRFFGCESLRGTSLVAGRMNVYGPGVVALMARNAALFRSTSWPSWAKSAHTRVKWCLSSRPRIRRIRSAPARLPIWQPRA